MLTNGIKNTSDDASFFVGILAGVVIGTTFQYFEPFESVNVMIVGFVCLGIVIKCHNYVYNKTGELWRKYVCRQ